MRPFLNMFTDNHLGGWRPVIRACMVLLLGWTASFLVKLYRIRSRFQQMQRCHLPMPPHHPLFGHLKLVASIMSKLPSDVHGHILPHQIMLALPDLGPVFYVDTWPFGPPMLVIAASEQAYQVSQAHSLPKFHTLQAYMRPMTGGNDMITMEGRQWKTWRNIYNTGFKSGHLLTLVPQIMEEMSAFCEILREMARKSEIVLMDPVASKLTTDIIGRVLFDTSFNSQRTENSLYSAMRNQTRWLSFGNEANLLNRYHPFRPLMQWWYSRTMEQYIGSVLDLRFKSKTGIAEVEKRNRSKMVIDLALDEYLVENPESGSTMDATFRQYSISQIRTFAFAGHDTTSSVICYMFHILSKYPSSRNLLTEEHNRVLGPQVDQALPRILEDPQPLNQLPFTLAVIKETLRLYPPASSTRSGEPGYHVPGPNGHQLPTEGFLVWINSHAIHHNAKYYPEPEKFLPERWLVEEGHRLYPPKGAFRPFEFGPRNCIGQELAMLELRIVLVMTIREFEIKTAFDEWDRLHPSRGPKTMNGDRAYQILDGAAHPPDGCPCRVSLANNS